MIQPHTGTTATRIAAGQTTYSWPGGTDAVNVSVSYGVTFTTVTAFICTNNNANNFDCTVTPQTVGTSSVTVRVANRTSGGVIAATGGQKINWLVIGIP